MQSRSHLLADPRNLRGEAVAFIAQLIRLQHEMCEVAGRLDRIEGEMRRMLNEFNRARAEDYL